MSGDDIRAADVARAIELSETKYCSVGAMVQKTARFHTTCEIVEDKTVWMQAAQAVGAER